MTGSDQVVGLGIYDSLLHKDRKELIAQLTRAQVPWHPACVSPVSSLQLIIFPSKHFMGLIEIFIRDNETLRSTWIDLQELWSSNHSWSVSPPPSWCLLVSICPQLVSPKWQLYSEPISLQSKPTPSLVLWHSAFIKPTGNSPGLDSNSVHSRNRRNDEAT